VLIALIALGLRRHWFPLGVPGQWEWLRIKIWPTPLGLLLSLSAVGLYAAFAALGLRDIQRRKEPSRLREIAWLIGLLVAAVLAQIGVQAGAADEYDLTKWAYVNYFPSSTGYYKIAHEQMTDAPGRFLADYSDWISRQDSLHIGTHPPGLFVAHWLLARKVGEHPELVSLLSAVMPSSTREGFRQLQLTNQIALSRSDQAALFLAGMLTLIASAGTVVPLYLLARVERGASVAWCAAAFWPLASAAILFQPVADTAYPLLSTTALAATSWGLRDRIRRSLGVSLAVLTGVILGIGMFCSLVFLPVGMIVAALIVTDARVSTKRRAGVIVAVGLGFSFVTGLTWLATGSNPFVTWWWNQHHHARFYDEYPRSYWLWFIENPIETMVALGIPSTIWCLIGFGAAGRGRPELALTRATWVTLAVLVMLNLMGKNLGEVGRLWQPFLPPLLIAASAGLLRLDGGPRTLGASIGLLGIQAIVLQTAIQVVYPV
jgi:hypothetical protein